MSCHPDRSEAQRAQWRACPERTPSAHEGSRMGTCCGKRPARAALRPKLSRASTISAGKAGPSTPLRSGRDDSGQGWTATSATSKGFGGGQFRHAHLGSIFCRGEILRGWRIGGRAIRRSWPGPRRVRLRLPQRQLWRRLPNLRAWDECPRHFRVRRARYRPSTTGLRYLRARSLRCGRSHPGRLGDRPGRQPGPAPASVKAAPRSLAY